MWNPSFRHFFYDRLPSGGYPPTHPPTHSQHNFYKRRQGARYIYKRNKWISLPGRHVFFLSEGMKMRLRGDEVKMEEEGGFPHLPWINQNEAKAGFLFRRAKKIKIKWIQPSRNSHFSRRYLFSLSVFFFFFFKIVIHSECRLVCVCSDIYSSLYDNVASIIHGRRKPHRSHIL